QQTQRTLPKLRRILTGHASNPPIGIGTKPGVLQPEPSTPITSITATIADPKPKYTTHEPKSLTTALVP
ncbi:hypothetical protein, partial [Mycobacterium ostraviense]|uniref:hypothetical protein n=1 Tax=Mycobacterium ostraviense TaxID=2738409 RepID=UPI001A7E57AD